MKKYLIILILLIPFIFLGCSRKQTRIRAGEYRREIIFQTRPATAPYYLPPVSTDYWGADFKPVYDSDSLKSLSNYRYLTRLEAPALGYFWALNCDELAFINRREGRIYILDLETGSYRSFKPEVGHYNRLRFFWVGPKDEFYVSLMLSESNPPYTSRSIGIDTGLFRFERIGDEYFYDDNSRFPSGMGLNMIRISPLNNLFISNWGSAVGGKNKTIYNDSGFKIGSTDGDGENLKGRKFSITGNKDRGYYTVKARLVDNDSCILIEETKLLTSSSNFKYTLDNKLIVYCHNMKNIEHDNGQTVPVNYPVLFGKDFNTGQHFNIDLENLGRKDYRYYSVNDISISYTGDIYAIAVYFNRPGEPGDDQLVVLYRWRTDYR